MRAAAPAPGRRDRRRVWRAYAAGRPGVAAKPAGGARPGDIIVPAPAPGPILRDRPPSARPVPMKRLLGYFLRGLVLVAPLAVTAYVCWLVFVTIDGWLGLPVPGAGFAATVLLVTLVGFLGSSLAARTLAGLLALVERAVTRLPFVRLLYTSTKDLLNAFVGERRRFDRPVTLDLGAGGLRLLGFVTSDDLRHLGLRDHVAVYVPQSYNFAGNLVVAPASSVAPLAADSAAVMAFIVSGGVTSGK